MEFSDPYNSTISAWSPDGRFVAVATEYRVYAREAASLRVTNIFTCLDTVDQILWSADSGYLLCSMHKRGVVQAWSLEHPEWVCKIDEGMSGLRYSRWSPDGAYILNFADFQLHTTIWSLVHRTRAYIKFPKFFDRGCAFSRDGQFLALADRQNMKDHISIFSCESWHVLKRFSVGTSDLDDVSWAPDDHAICVWDSALVYRVMLYSPDGRKLAQYCAYENGLGIKTVRWCSDGKFLAIGSYDAKLRILNELTWRPLATYDHARVIARFRRVAPSILVPNNPVVQLCRHSIATWLRHRYHRWTAMTSRSNNSRAATVASAVIYKETTFYDSVKQCSHSRYELQATPFTLGPVSAARPTQTVSKFEDENIGITCVEWSCDSRLLCSRDDARPHAIWVWDAIQMSLLALIVHARPVLQAKWHPSQQRLAICTGTENLFLWNLQGSSCVQLPPANFRIRQLEWNPDGQALLLVDQRKCCCAYFVE